MMPVALFPSVWTIMVALESYDEPVCPVTVDYTKHRDDLVSNTTPIFSVPVLQFLAIMGLIAIMDMGTRLSGPWARAIRWAENNGQGQQNYTKPHA
ncbi:hypothetical protein FALBO_7048 [Fusarium albosuccineum]|uniref:Uncharacterized protein n=1 Tax=Fusarium albosuccineum TaxID=1237068 RepID=A0A8H4LAI7_9HYPO|nr:hypothetical protein FALBO_7048 [Fusarium albosuccineum]